MASVGKDGTLILWNIDNWPPKMLDINQNCEIKCISICTKKQYLATGNDDNSILIWNLESGKKKC